MNTSASANRRATRRTQAERTEESGKRLIEAAVDLILERGPRLTSLKDVGEKAGYSRGLANYRFGSKEGLFRAVLIHSRRQWLAELDADLGDKRGLDAILAAIAAFERFLSRTPRHYRAMVLLWYNAVGHRSPLNNQLRKHHAAQLRDVRRWVEQGIADGTIDPAVDPVGFAASFYSWMFGTVYQWQIQPHAFDLNALFENYRFLVLRALGTGRSTRDR